MTCTETLLRPERGDMYGGVTAASMGDVYGDVTHRKAGQTTGGSIRGH